MRGLQVHPRVPKRLDKRDEISQKVQNEDEMVVI
jgi:hypothetical protein